MNVKPIGIYGSPSPSCMSSTPCYSLYAPASSATLGLSSTSLSSLSQESASASYFLVRNSDLFEEFTSSRMVPHTSIWQLADGINWMFMDLSIVNIM